jgi:hypothetical protein
VNRDVTTYNERGGVIFDEASMNYSHSQFLRFVTDEYIRDVRRERRSIEEFYKALSKMDVTDAKSLLYIKNYLQYKSWENINFDTDDYKNLLIDYLKGCRNPLQEFNNLIYNKIENHLPENYLNWLKDDLRCSLFIGKLIESQLQFDAYKGAQEFNEAVADYLRYDIHMFIAYYPNNLPNYLYQHDKKGEWKTVDLLYVKSTYFKNRIEDKEVKWIDSNDDEQITWIYDYLSNDEKQSIILKGVFIPTTIKERYDLILASLDILSNVPSDNIGTRQKKGFSQRSYTLLSMKKAWDGRKQYGVRKDANNGITIKIYKKNQAKLKELVTYSGFTTCQLLNNSIEQMYDQLILDKNEEEGSS